jgi:hypothetical protein
MTVVLGSKELSALLALLRQDDAALETSLGNFMRLFPKDSFRAACAVCVLLMDRLLTSTQVCVSGACR